MNNMKYPFTLKVEFDHAALKELVETGKLSLFMDTFSTAIGQEVKSQIIGNMAKPAIAGEKFGSALVITAGFDGDDFAFGNGPKIPIPHNWGTFSGIIEANLREIVRQEIRK